MGGVKKRENKGTYYQLYNGSVVRNYMEEPQDDEVYLHRITPESKRDIWYQAFDEIGGTLVSVALEETEKFGMRYLFTFEHDSERFILQVGESSSYASSFLDRMVNIDLSQSVLFRPYSFTDKQGKKRIGFSIFNVNENGTEVKIASAYTKDEPNGKPQATVFTTGKNKGKWDFSKVEDFLFEEFEKWTAINFGSAEEKEVVEPEVVSGKKTPTAKKAVSTSEPDSLPF